MGEGADDAGGVFDDTIAQMMEELQTQTVKLLILTPNGRNETGYNQDRFLFNSKMNHYKQLQQFQFLGINIDCDYFTILFTIFIYFIRNAFWCCYKN